MARESSAASVCWAIEIGAKLETRNKKLEQEKEELTSIKIEAKTLIAAGITPVALNKRSKEQDKVDKVTKIRVDFTLRKNTIGW